MTRIKGPVVTHSTGFGWVRASMTDHAVVGDRLVPSPIEVDFPGADGQPALTMFIEVVGGVPRCTELTLRRSEDGREIRTKDLKNIIKGGLDSWIETVVAMCSGEIQESKPGEIAAAFGGQDRALAGMRTIRDARKGSRRPLTPQRKQRVADVYNAHETGGIDAVQTAFTGISRSTATRYIKAAREAGLIEKRDQ